jgi:hypothetical protein
MFKVHIRRVLQIGTAAPKTYDPAVTRLLVLYFVLERSLEEYDER